MGKGSQTTRTFRRERIVMSDEDVLDMLTEHVKKTYGVDLDPTWEYDFNAETGRIILERETEVV